MSILLIVQSRVKSNACMVYIYFSNSLIIHEQNRKATTAQRKQYINRVSVHYQHINTSKCFKKTRLAPRISNTLSRVWYASNKHLLVYYILLFFASLASTIYNGTELRHTDHNGTELRASFQLRTSYGQTCTQTEDGSSKSEYITLTVITL